MSYTHSHNPFSHTPASSLGTGLIAAGAECHHADILRNAYLYDGADCVTLLRQHGAGKWGRLHVAASLGDARAFDAYSAEEGRALDDRGFSPRAIALLFGTTAALGEHALRQCPQLTPQQAAAVQDQLLIEAAKRGQVDVCKARLAAAPYHGGAEMGRNALHWAARIGNVGVLGLLIARVDNAKALMDAPAALSFGGNCVQMGAYNSDLATVKLLVEAGAAVTQRDVACAEHYSRNAELNALLKKVARN